MRRVVRHGFWVALRPDPDAVAIALEQAWHAIANQLDRLKGFHDRSTTLLGASTIGASFLAGFDSSGSIDVNKVAAWCALLAFVTQVGFTIYVLYPRTLSFSRSASWLGEQVLDRKVSNAVLRERLLSDAAKAVERNRKEINKIGYAYTTVLMSFAVAVGLSIAALMMGSW